MLYAEIKNGNVVIFPYDYDILCKENPYTNFTQQDLPILYNGTVANLNGNELVSVIEEAMPTYNKQTQSVSLNSNPTLVNGVWTLSWIVSDLTQDQQNAVTQSKATSVRQQRDAKLSACDWTQTVDSPLTNKSAWATYRQALRDLPKETGFPWTMTWPTDPNGKT